MSPLSLLLRVIRRNSQHQDGMDDPVDVALVVWLAAVALLIASVVVFALFKLVLMAMPA